MTEPIIETPVAPTVPVTEPVSTTTLTAEEAEKVRTNAKEMVARHAEKAEKATAELKAHKEKLAADAKEADRAKLEESDRLKLDIKEKDEQIADMKTKARQDKVENAIRLAGLKEGVVNADHLVKLMDASGVELAEDGSVTGLDEAVVKFKEENPFMFGKQATGGPIPPVDVARKGDTPPAPEDAWNKRMEGQAVVFGHVATPVGADDS